MVMEENPDYPCCYTDEIWIRRGKRVNPRKKHAKYSGWIYNRCLPLCIISPSSVMLRRGIFEQIGFFDEAFPVCEDYDLWLRLTARYPVFFIEKPLIMKRGGHDDQLSSRNWGNDIYRVKAIEKMLQMGVRVEQQALAKHGLEFVARTYLPNKLKNTGAFLP